MILNLKWISLVPSLKWRSVVLSLKLRKNYAEGMVELLMLELIGKLKVAPLWLHTFNSKNRFVNSSSFWILQLSNVN